MFAKIKTWACAHWYALFVAVVVACIAGLPQIIDRFALGPDYHGIPYLVNDSEGEYMSRVHEVLDGHISLASPMLYEYKDSVALMPATGEILFYALPVKLTGLSLATVVTISKFVYPAILFFFTYLFILSLLNKTDRGAKLSAIAGALLIVIGYDAHDYRSFVSTILHGAPGSPGLLWNRLVNPITGAILLFAFLWLAARMIREKGTWRTTILTGFVAAAMSGYIFSFALAMSIGALLVVYFIWQKNWRIATRYCLALAIAIAANGVYLTSILFALRGALPLANPQKVGLFYTHVPLLNMISLLTLAVAAGCFAIFFRRDTGNEYQKRWWFFVLAVVSCCIIVYNQQLITGRTIWPQHFVQYTIPLAMAVAVILLHNIFRSHMRLLWLGGTACVALVAVLFGWRGFEAATQNAIPFYAEEQQFAGVSEYLNAHAAKDCVVYVGAAYLSPLNRFLPGLTSCNDYHTYYLYSGVPSERIRDNYLLNLRLRNIKPTDVKKHFYADPFFTTSYFFRNWSDVLCNNLSGCGEPWLEKITDKEEIDRWFAGVEKEVEQKYTEYLKGDLYAQLTKYRVDYFVVDTRQQPQVNDSKYHFLSYRAAAGPYIIYALIKP